MTIPTKKFCNGIEFPAIGFGSLLLKKGTVTSTIEQAIDVGYRHFDCATFNGNECEVGRAFDKKLKSGAVKREDLFITAKLWNTKHHPSLVRAACENTLRLLKINYLDCYIMHWPMGFANSNDLFPKDATGKTLFSDVDYVDTWSAMEELVNARLCRSIGLANFNQKQIERILHTARIQPMNLQIECHPYLTQKALRDFCNDRRIVVTAYGSLGSPNTPLKIKNQQKLLDHPTIVTIAGKYGKTPAQILLRYQIDLGNAVVTMTNLKEQMVSNLSIGNFTLCTGDMTIINGLNIGLHSNLLTCASGHPHHPFEVQCTALE